MTEGMLPWVAFGFILGVYLLSRRSDGRKKG